MSIFELSMLICFGIGWPVSVAKAIRTKNVSGKSPVFMAIILIGYISGITHKFLFSFDVVIAVYIFNAGMVATDLALYFKYTTKDAARFRSLRRPGIWRPRFARWPLKCAAVRVFRASARWGLALVGRSTARSPRNRTASPLRPVRSRW